MNWYFKTMEIDSIEKILQIEPNAIGFIYEISLTNGKKYIGKKDLFFNRKKKLGKKEIAELPDKRMKKYKHVKSESNWKVYNGSSKRLLADLEAGEEILTRQILEFCTTKSLLTYTEVKYQFLHEVLEQGDKYYNDTILGKFFKRIFNG